jgi:adenylate cyclase
MAADEGETLARLKAHRKELIEPKTAEYHGRVVKLMGDGTLMEFGSVVDAVSFAVDFQQAMVERNVKVPEDRRIIYRVGINIGDIIVDGDDIYGDGVNVAARLEGLAQPGGVCISQTVFNHVRKKVDLTFVDLGEKQVKNIPDPVRVYRIDLSGTDTDSVSRGSDAGGLPLPDKPSIAVLPFENMSGDPEQEFFADGMAEEIITALSRYRWFFVIARNSSFTYKGRAVDVTQVAKELGVRYVLEGSVRKAGNRVRVTAQLIDATTGNHIWAERYDRELDDIFALQDDITEAIVAAIEPELGGVERERAFRKLPGSLDVWGLYQRGLWHIYQFTREDRIEALSLFKQARELDSKFGPAHAGVSFAHFLAVYLGYTEDREADLANCYEAARKSVECDEKDPVGHWVLARAHLLRGEHERAIAEFTTAIELNPSFAQGYYNLGWALVQAGRPVEALPHLDKAYRLSPHDPLVFAFMNVRSLALVLMGDLEQAFEWAAKATRQPHAHFHTFAIAAVCAALFGREDEARRAVDEIILLRPNYSCSFFEQSYPFKQREDLERFLDGLRKAGLPD